MIRTYADITGDYYDNLDKTQDWREDRDLKIFDYGNWVPIETFLKEKI